MKHCRYCRNASGRGLFIILAFLVMGPMLHTPLLYSQASPDIVLDGVPDIVRGDRAMAERYAAWIKNLADSGQWTQAHAALERASDFSAVSSDLSYLLALARFNEGKSRYAVLEALETAIRADRWNMYSEEDARFFKAENLIAIKHYSEALVELSKVRKGPREAALTLRALVSFRPDEFRRYMTDTLDRYPRESEPVRIFFNYLRAVDAAGHNPSMDEIQLLELVIRRLPVLLIRDPELAWMAAPFMRDIDEARRLVLAYRAVNTPVHASLPAALMFGAIGEEMALEELFDASREKSLDIIILEEVWSQLRTEESRALFKRNLSLFSGVITEDADRDGIPEISAEYRLGMLLSSVHDPFQGKVPELAIGFEAGVPRQASYYMPPGGNEPVFSPVNYGGRKQAVILWERYPAVEEVEMDGIMFIPRPLDFQFSPVKFVDLWGSGVLFPMLDPLNPPLTRRVLVHNSIRIERPSLEFEGGIEVVELSQNIPERAREYVGDLMVAETDFLRGRPQLQRVDLDFDGRMETFRFFNRNYRSMEPDELWNYDRDIDYTVENWDGL